MGNTMLNEPKLSLRKAVYEDMDVLFEWANDPVVRKNSFNTNQIMWDEHASWFDRVLKDEGRILYIFEVDGVSAGTMRLDYMTEHTSSGQMEAEVSYSLAPEFRGKGYGKRMLRLLEDEIHASSLGIDCIVARVKPDNARSSRSFLDTGYEEEYIQYRKKLG